MPATKFCCLTALFLSTRLLSAADTQADRKVTAEDMPRIPSTAAADAVGTFRLAKGFKAEMVAAEPLVSDPIDACFDASGRMFVAEMHGYPFSHEPTKLNPEGGGKKDAGIVRMLQDTDGDGIMDRSEVFADGISWPTSVCCYDDGIFVLAPQYLYYFKDTDGDGRADIREVVLTGFGRGNVQALTNGLQWGLDNRIDFAAGRNPADLIHRGKPLFSVRGSDLKFNPKDETFQPIAGGLQFGHSRDDWGVRFVCSNSNHIQQIVYPREYLARNPYYVAPTEVRSIAADGASARVFRRSPPEPWRIIRQKWRAADKGYKLVINDDGGWEFIPMDPSKKAGVVPTEYPVGFFTSATGITIYRGDAYPEEFRGNAFVGDVGGNLVHRKTVQTDSIQYSAKRADEGEELLASSDNWFRPVNFVNAPDGCLYILDMYRETIEHPHSIPQEIKQFLDLTSGHDKGRIYRLVSPDADVRPVKNLAAFDTTQLVQELDSTNGWNRDTAQRLLWEREDQTAVAALRRLMESAQTPTGVLHAMWTLHGLNALRSEDLESGLQHEHGRVRAHAVQLLEPYLDQPDQLARLAALLDDDNEHVRFQVALTLGESSLPQAADLLAQMLADSENGAHVRIAAFSSAGRFADRIVDRLTHTPESLQQSHVLSAVAELGLMIGSNPDPTQSISLMQKMLTQPEAVQRVVLTELGRGLARRGTSLLKVLPAERQSDEEALIDVFVANARAALDQDQPLKIRQGAIELLAFADFDTASQSLPELLTSSVPPPLQQAAVAALGRMDHVSIAQLLLQEWRSYSPATRRVVVSELLSTPARIAVLLDAVAAGEVRRSDIERSAIQQLATHKDKSIRARSQKLLTGDVQTNRSKVVADYQDVLKLTGDISRGQAVFRKTCSVCHKVGDMGHNVAPELKSVKNKSEADLLIAILDPNREALPNYNLYSLVTEQGRTVSGIIAAETANAITLRRAEGKEDVVLRSNIEEMASTGVSLMPEGLEKELTQQQLADVIAFVKSIGDE